MFSFLYVSCKHDTAHICCCGAGHGRAAINRYVLPAGPTVANPPHAAAAGELDRQTDGQTNKQTDRQTDTVQFHRPRLRIIFWQFIPITEEIGGGNEREKPVVAGSTDAFKRLSSRRRRGRRACADVAAGKYERYVAIVSR